MTNDNTPPPPLDAGMYRLNEPVTNPSPDRRSKDWYNQPQFPPGRYRLRLFKRDSDYARPGWEVRIANHHERYGAISALWHDGQWHSNKSGVPELAAALVRDTSLDGHLRYADVEDYIGPREVILALVEAGVVSEDAVRMAVENVRLQHELELAKEGS